MRHYIFVMILMFLGVATTSYAQRTRKVHGEYIYHAPENVSLEQAKKTALSRAQIQPWAMSSVPWWRSITLP